MNKETMCTWCVLKQRSGGLFVKVCVVQSMSISVHYNYITAYDFFRFCAFSGDGARIFRFLIWSFLNSFLGV